MSEPIYNSAGEVLYPGLAGDGAGYRGSRLVTLKPESWEKAEGAWPLMQDAPVPEAKTGYAALGSYPDNYGAAAQEAGCPAYCEAGDGFVRFYARAKPSGDIRVQVTLLGNAGGTVVTGLVAGSGVRVNPTLTISGAAADAKAVGDRLKPLEGYSGGYLGIWPVTLTADGWAECTDVPGYAYKQTAQLRAAREANVPSAVPTPETFTVAVAAGLAGVCETKDGSITFWAEKVPEGGIQMQVELLGPSASTADTGEDTLGDTVLEDTTL